MSDKNSVVIHVFTQDFRLSDNPSLFYANEIGPVWPIFIDDRGFDPFPPGGCSCWWLYHSLLDIQKRLGGCLSIFQGEFSAVIERLVQDYDIQGVFWNLSFDAYRQDQQNRTLNFLKKSGIAGRSFNGSTLWDPWTIKKMDGTCYKVFTPFYRKGCLQGMIEPRPVEPSPEKLNLVDLAAFDSGMVLDESNILPKHSWHSKLHQHWKVSEDAAMEQLESFLEQGISNYKKGRDFPMKENVSMLSPYLHFGNVSVSQVWEKVSKLPQDENTGHFMSELGWREFSYYLLHHFQDLPKSNLQSKFDAFPWVVNESQLKAWKKGLTGIPFVDAGMRQLWQCGYMHNRMRMVVGSFLVKNLRHHWKEGEMWFRECLVDFDLANNSASWQWVAGCGTDAAPYFRIFNPVTQGQRFDPQGEYTRHYLPELKNLPLQYLFNPWEAPDDILKEAGVVLGENYPKPMVDLKLSRQQALDAFQSL